MVGERVFAHESGLHADGVLKDPHNYEGFDPAEVGLSRMIVVGKHSGTSGLAHRLASLGIHASRAELQAVMPVVRGISQEKKGAVTDAELLEAFRGALRRAA